MTGKKPNPEKLPLSEFRVEDGVIRQCPQGNSPIRTYLASGVYSAHFAKETCDACPLHIQCPVKSQKKDYVLRASQKAVIASTVRAGLSDPEQRKPLVCKRAGIEGTNSALKRGENAGKLRVRGMAKCRVVIGLKIIARNVKQFSRAMMKKPSPGICQGVDLSFMPG